MRKFPATALLLALTLLSLSLTACQSRGSAKFVGSYQAVLPSATTAGRRLTLTLNADNSATLTNDFMNGQTPAVETGAWLESSGDKVIVTLSQINGEPEPETVEITFQLYEDRLFVTDFVPGDYLPSVGLQLKKIQ